MGKSHFFAFVHRMRYINRWGLMNNTKCENLSEHSTSVAMFTHALILMHNKKYGDNLSAEKGAVIALYHDSSEIITGDMPTPIKYFSKDITKAYKSIEKNAEKKLLSLLPLDLQDDYRDILSYSEKDKMIWFYVKVADKLSALTKCIEELRMGNKEFNDAYDSVLKTIKDMNSEIADEFLETFIPSFELTLDMQK
ncbi:MAG: 5'-deoxynucleotidase [Acutalibacteraceae bacterium]